MDVKGNYTGFAIALAWPQTFCKQPGSWYDPLALRLGLNKNHYYRVGHAAVVLIDAEKGTCHYFDFGRYHAPFQHGRVRSAETDHELSMKTIPVLSRDKSHIVNFPEILSEPQQNNACHGEGPIFASYAAINFQAAFAKATSMQHSSPIPYGPFLISGSNCSRFVNAVIRAGKPHLKFGFRLKYRMWFTPTPMNNVNALYHRNSLPVQTNNIPISPVRKLDSISLNSTLMPPSRHKNIPANAQWLGGEGAGSWFVFETQHSQLSVTRYSPEGTVECTGLFRSQKNEDISPDNSYRITHPSNCKIVSLVNRNGELRFERKL